MARGIGRAAVPAYAATLVTIGVLLTGCAGDRGDGAGGDGDRAVPPTPAAVRVETLDCGVKPTGPDSPLPASPTALAWCPPVLETHGVQSGPATPRPPTMVRGDLTRLVTALGRPDEPGVPGGSGLPSQSGPPRACTLNLVLLPEFWLVDAAGWAYRPHVPRTSCGKPQPEVAAALAELHVPGTGARPPATD